MALVWNILAQGVFPYHIYSFIGLGLFQDLDVDVWKNKTVTTGNKNLLMTDLGNDLAPSCWCQSKAPFPPIHNINRPPHLLLYTAGGERR